MCTVTFIPKTGGYILTSTRDEHFTRRKAKLPVNYPVHGKKVFFPKDMHAGGTWIASSEDGITICLLNGAFMAHKPSPPYRQSRGLMLLEYFRYESNFKSDFDFSGIEPFTMLILTYSHKLFFEELRWDGNKVFHRSIDSTLPQIWQSATLYAPDVKKIREDWFNEWLKNNKAVEMEDVVSFYKSSGTDDKKNAYIMNRNDQVLSVSLTSVEQINDLMKMRYEDLITEEVCRVEWMRKSGVRNQESEIRI
jgi:hypothetical protein